MDLEAHIARIDRAQEDVRKFVAETRNPAPTPWPLLIASMVTGAAIFGLKGTKVLRQPYPPRLTHNPPPFADMKK